MSIKKILKSLNEQKRLLEASPQENAFNKVVKIANDYVSKFNKEGFKIDVWDEEDEDGKFLYITTPAMSDPPVLVDTIIFLQFFDVDENGKIIWRGLYAKPGQQSITSSKKAKIQGSLNQELGLKDNEDKYSEKEFKAADINKALSSYLKKYTKWYDSLTQK